MDENKDITISTFRECFGTEAGQKVLGMLLVELDFYNAKRETPTDIAKANLATRLLQLLGVGLPGNEFNIAKSIMNMPFTLGEKNE